MRRRTPFVAEGRGNIYGEVTCLQGSATPHIPREQSSSAPHFWDSHAYIL